MLAFLSLDKFDWKILSTDTTYLIKFVIWGPTLSCIVLIWVDILGEAAILSDKVLGLVLGLCRAGLTFKTLGCSLTTCRRDVSIGGRSAWFWLFWGTCSQGSGGKVEFTSLTSLDLRPDGTLESSIASSIAATGKGTFSGWAILKTLAC